MELTPEYEALATAGAGRVALWQTLRARLREHFTLLKFATTGIGGYIVYQLVFLLFYESPLVWFLPAKGEELRLLAFSHSDARLLITTLVAAELSIVAVFSGHHLWTFRDRRTDEKPIWLRFIQFNGKAAVSSLGTLDADRQPSHTSIRRNALSGHPYGHGGGLPLELDMGLAVHLAAGSEAE